MPAPWLALLAQGDAQLQKGGVSWLAASFLLKQLTVPREELPLTEERQRADGDPSATRLALFISNDPPRGCLHGLHLSKRLS